MALGEDKRKKRVVSYKCGNDLKAAQGEHMEKAMTATHLPYAARCTFIYSYGEARRLAGWQFYVLGKSGFGSHEPGK